MEDSTSCDEWDVLSLLIGSICIPAAGTEMTEQQERHMINETVEIRIISCYDSVSE